MGFINQLITRGPHIVYIYIYTHSTYLLSLYIYIYPYLCQQTCQRTPVCTLFAAPAGQATPQEAFPIHGHRAIGILELTG